jgi:hypothetical protein
MICYVFWKYLLKTQGIKVNPTRESRSPVSGVLYITQQTCGWGNMQPEGFVVAVEGGEDEKGRG